METTEQPQARSLEGVQLLEQNGKCEFEEPRTSSTHPKAVPLRVCRWRPLCLFALLSVSSLFDKHLQVVGEENTIQSLVTSFSSGDPVLLGQNAGSRQLSSSGL